jgi:hypothetical protein
MSISHGFGPWEQVDIAPPPAHKKDKVLTDGFDDNAAGLHLGRRLRQFSGGIGAKEECVCDHENYGHLFNDGSFRTVRIKYLNRAFSDGLDG